MPHPNGRTENPVRFAHDVASQLVSGRMLPHFVFSWGYGGFAPMLAQALDLKRARFAPMFKKGPPLLHCVEAALQVGKDVVDVLGADGEADGARVNALVGQLLGGELAVGCGGRVDD